MLWRRALHRAVRRLAALPLSEVPEARLIVDLGEAWENIGWAADADYLVEVARQAATTSGPILECGSGLTTILLGCLAGRRGVPVWTLEHDEQWRNRTALALQPLRGASIELRLAPLRDYGGYTWYDPPLVHMPADFRLVVCDGPPGITPGGRYGLLPVMASRFAHGAVILMEDADRAAEAEVMARWSVESSVAIERRTPPGGCFAVVTCP